MVPQPDQTTRYGLLRNLIEKQRHNLIESEVRKIVKLTEGYSCSDISLVCKDAAMGPIRDLGAKILETGPDDMPPIQLKHFIDSLKNIRASLSPQSLNHYLEWDKQFGSKLTLSMNALPESMKPTHLEKFPIKRES